MLFEHLQGNANQPASLQATEDKSSKKQKKAQQDMLVQLDVDAIVDHATEVAAMLPGGQSAHVNSLCQMSLPICLSRITQLQQTISMVA